MIFFARAYLRHLEKEVEHWRTMHQHERQRAELLTDRLLEKHHVAPVTTALIDDRPPATDTEALLRDALRNDDMVRAGHE